MANSFKSDKKSSFAFGGYNSNSRMPYEKKTTNHDVFTICNGIATGDNKNSRSLKREGNFLLRLKNISYDYRRIYTQLRSALEVYDIREIILSSSENFFIINVNRVGIATEILLMKILLIDGQLILSLNLDKLPKNCDGLTFVDVNDEDALNFNIAISTMRDIIKCTPILGALMDANNVPKRVSRLFEQIILNDTKKN